MLPVHPDDKDNFFLFNVIIMEHLWWIRNQLLHNDQVGSTEASLAWIESKYKELSMAFEFRRRQGLDRRPKFFWCKPSTGFIKLNTDVAMAKKGSFLAVVARNDRGDLLHIYSFKSPISIPVIEELKGVLKSMQLTSMQRWTRVCVESDSLNVINCLASG